MNATFAKMGIEIYQYMWGLSEFTVTGIPKNTDVSQILSQLNISCLFTCDEFDEARPSTVTTFAGLVPNAKILVISGASHSHHLEKQEDNLQ